MKGFTATEGIISSFKERNFRYLLFADVLDGVAEQMEFVVLAWFVLTQTNSPFLVGVYGALRYGGTLFSPFYGIIADRYNRKKVLLLVRSGFIFLAIYLLFLSLSDRLVIWQVFVITGIFGCVRGFDGVMRDTILPDLLEDSAILSNAVGLNRMARDATQMIGPIVAGLMLSKFGTSETYVVIIVIYIFAVLILNLLNPKLQETIDSAKSVLGDISLTFKYINRQKAVLSILLICILVNVTAFPTNHGLLPVFARDVLGTGSAGLGLLLAMFSSGALLGSIGVALSSKLKNPGKYFIFGTLAWHFAIFLLSQSKSFAFSIPLLLAAGIAQSVTMVILTILLLRLVVPELRGRVLGIRHLAVYGLLIGILISGAMADAWDAPVALLVNSLTGIGVVVLMQVSGLFRQLFALK